MRRLAGLLLCWALICTGIMGQENEGLEEQALLQPAPIPQISISVFMMKMSPELAADWGLDGGPAAKPESTPLKKDIPKLLSPEDARKVITALRKTKGCEIIGSTSIVAQSGQEAFGAQVKEAMFPETYDMVDVYYPEPKETADAEDDDDDDEPLPEPVKTARKLPKTPTMWDLGPIMGEPREDLGVTLTASPHVAENDSNIMLDIHPKLVVEKKADPTFFMFSTFELRSLLTIPDGFTMIAFSGTPAPRGDFLKYEDDASTDRRPYIMFVTAKIVEFPGKK